MTLAQAGEGVNLCIESVQTGDPELDSFLFTLGCYEGQNVVVVSRRRGGCTVSLKDGRYSFDSRLAEAVTVRCA